MGNDPDCARWIRALPRGAAAGHGRPGEQRGRRGGGARRRAAAGTRGCRLRRCRREPQRSPRRLHALRAARAASRRHDGARRPRAQLGVDIDSVCGGRGDLRPLPGAGGEGEFAKHGVALERGITVADLGDRARTLRQPQGAGRGPPARLPGAGPGRRRGRRAAREPGPPAGGPQGRRRRATSRSTRSSGCTTSRWPSRTSHDPSGDLAAARAGARSASGSSTDLDVRPRRSLRGLQPALRKGEWKVTVAVHDDATHHRRLAGLHEAAYGVAVDVGSTTIAAHLCDLADGRGRWRRPA